MTTRSRLRLLSTAAAALLAGCILRDDSYTFYLQPDGKADVVGFLDRIRSSKEGLERTREEAEWLSDFTRGADDMQGKLKRTGAVQVKAVLLRDVRPYSAAVRGSYDSMDGLARFLDLDGKSGRNTMSFRSDGRRRELDIRVEASTPTAKSEPPPAYPVLKFVAVDGVIEEAKGFKVAADSASCVMDLAAGGEYFLAWRVEKD